ncbi:MAG TPA: flotillin-like protein FloA [Phycisphaerales bacterium]|nr:flotillin-like protein FloA [Phycisphaerales bacterium]
MHHVSMLTLAQATKQDMIIWVVIGIVGLVLFFVFIFLLQFISLYIQAMTSNAHVGMLDMIGMKLRKVDIRTVVINRIRAVKSGMDIPTNMIETHYLAGGRVSNVISAMIAARGARIELPWNIATAIDLAGRDILDAVHTSVNPKVIDCPSANGPRGTIDAVAKDGIQLKVKARVTVRTNIARLVGGATEETIIARVGQGIVSTIGSANDHKAVLENPDDISKKVMSTGLDAGTAFEILSIDIADVDVGDNIGAQLQAAQAEADKKRFQAEAEKRRALALALEQENKARIEENKALVVLAEADVPKAIADAFRNGRLGVMDYYKLQNLQADTSMRGSIAGDGNTRPNV